MSSLGLVNLSNFKIQIRKLFVPTKKSIFGVHHPYGIKRLFQLRLGLSPLRKHKYNHKFSDTPSSICDCGTAPEDTEHFVLKCPLFSTQRASLLERVTNVLAEKAINVQNTQTLIRTCLYGHHELSDNANKIILKATIKFILESNRFS